MVPSLQNPLSILEWAWSNLSSTPPLTRFLFFHPALSLPLSPSLSCVSCLNVCACVCIPSLMHRVFSTVMCFQKTDVTSSLDLCCNFWWQRPYGGRSNLRTSRSSRCESPIRTRASIRQADLCAACPSSSMRPSASPSSLRTRAACAVPRGQSKGFTQPLYPYPLFLSLFPCLLPVPSSIYHCCLRAVLSQLSVLPSAICRSSNYTSELLLHRTAHRPTN